MAIVVANTTNVMDAEKDMFAGGKIVAQKKNRIQVSNTKKPLFFYLNLAKRYIKQYNDVELSALGMAIPTVVTIAEILKSNGLAIEKRVATSTVGSKDDAKGRLVQKAKIEIVLEKTQKNDKKTPAATETKAAETPTAMETKDADTPAAMETKAADKE
uniref:DNA/RNA-binding protein Alba-like domain-containing protein n=1 Tax=Davidia involucrata TaxID=16924 RepID=A0A5B7C047_DAVIN